ncbi:hypothetical protein [Halorussus amylolyticus]|uniref:hypothetical protein n=1 Tax=Halorussus amylolyticus TaxID=1126242 RepID=UPI001044F263|nr:hypothetical protein [Halorussus amylolyticus]
MRTIAVLAVLALVVSSGCLSGVGDPIGENTPESETSTIATPSETTHNSKDMEGYLEIEIVDEVPDDATVVDANNETIRNVTVVQRAIENATTTEQNVTVHVTGEQVLEVEEGLGELPWYSGGRENPSGNYIRKNDRVVAVYLKVLA